MAEITAQMVMQLREQTGAGLMDAKKALQEAGGDVAKARDILRAKGKAQSDKRSGRAAAEGVVAVSDAPHAVSLIELNSETDFVARNEEFRQLAHQIAQAAAHTPHKTVEELLGVKLENGHSVRETVDEALAKMRENLVVRRTVRYEKTPESVIGSYVHRVDHKTGSLVELHGDPANAAQHEAARNIAMHIAANKPQYLRREDVPANVVEHEKQVLAEKTRNEGKPEAAVPKIVEGRINKFFEDMCLVDQPYVREPSKKVGQIAQEVGAQIRRFALFQVGQE